MNICVSVCKQKNNWKVVGLHVTYHWLSLDGGIIGHFFFSHFSSLNLYVPNIVIQNFGDLFVLFVLVLF